MNAYYDFSKNCIVIPAGILQPPYFNINSSYENNLGGIGSIIAHEITHAFDNTGARFDKDGKLTDWWSDEDYAAFDAICDRFVEQYDGIEVPSGLLCGRRTHAQREHSRYRRRGVHNRHRPYRTA